VIEDSFFMSDYNLLPIGFYDSFGSKAKLTYKMNNQIIDYLLENDFELFNPSPVEFHKEANFSEQSFTVLDPLSDKLLTIRSDITSQTSRAVDYVDTNYLKICYSGVVLRLNIDKNNHARSMRQTGFEIISNNSKKNVLNESVVFLSKLIKRIKYSSYTIVFSNISSVDLLSRVLKLNNFELTNIIKSNDIDKIISLTDKYNLREILSPKSFSFFKNREYQIYDSVFSSYFEKIRDDIIFLPEDFATKLVFDPLDLNFKDYHSGLCLKIVDSATDNIVIRGGKFKFSDYSNCFGATFYLEEITN
jgi:ATP phosphoribosyltransferase regulatory subunit HisZ